MKRAARQQYHCSDRVDSNDTRTDALIRAWKNHQLVAPFIASAIVMVGLVGVLQAYDYLSNWFWPPTPRMFAECRMGLMPSVMPPEGHIYILETYAQEEDTGGGLLDSFGPPGSKRNYTNVDGQPAWAYRCEFTNQSKDPLFNVSVPVHLTFRKPITFPVDAPKSRRLGEVILDRDWKIRVAKLDPPLATPFVFYIWNCCVQQFVQVALPASVRDGNNKEIQLLQSDHNLFEPLSPVPFN